MYTTPFGTVRLWEASAGARVQVLRPERCYERLDVTGLMGITDAQRVALLVLGVARTIPPRRRADRQAASGATA